MTCRHFLITQSYLGKSESLSALSSTMVHQQLRGNPALFAKFYEKVSRTLAGKASTRELYITAISIREACKIVTNYPELVSSAIKLGLIDVEYSSLSDN